MSTPKKTTAVPAIEEIKLSELEIDLSLSGRNEKEISANAKALAPAISAYGSWDVTQPGQYFERDGKKHLAAGFTRVAASKIAGIKTGHFVKIADNPESLRTACIRTNLGKPISAFEQGRIYKAMLDGGNAETAKPGEVVLAPMTPIEIAEEVGYSRVHIDNCIAMFESSPEIRELIADGKVAAGIVTLSRQQVKGDEGKQLRYLKAAVKAANAEGKECATKKHLDAVRADHAPLKAAKAETSTPPVKPEKPSKSTQDATETPTGETPEIVEQPDLSTLGSPAETPAPSKKQSTAARQTLFTVISKWLDATDTVCSDEDVNKLCDAIEEAAIPF